MNETKIMCNDIVRKNVDDFNLIYQSKWFVIATKHEISQTVIKMKIALNILTTEYFPSTYEILKNELPGIFSSKCFNDGELPFSIEVRKTEMAHLFEHILLEYLCDLKIENGYKTAKYCGETSWNWKKERRGLFNITVSSNIDEKECFNKALLKSIKLLNYIIAFGKYQERPLFEYGLPHRLNLFGSTAS